VRRLVQAILAACLLAGVAACGGNGPSNAAPADTKVLVALPLQVRARALGRVAGATADLRQLGFRRFLTIGEIAKRFGASAAVVAADQRVLARDGLHLAPDPTHAAFWGTVTAAQVKRYFGTTLVESSGAIAPVSPPKVPGGLRGVTGVVGLTSSLSNPSPVSGGSAAPPCPSGIPSRASLARLFGFEKSIASGATGAGTEIDILAVHGFQPAVFANFNRCTGSSLDPSSITQSVVPTTPPTGGGPEDALDTLVLALLAPGTRVHVALFDPSTPLVFPLIQTLEGRGIPNILDVTTTYCETRVAAPELALSEWLLAAFAASGTTTLAAAGDSGSSGCYPSTTPSVTYPASSRYAVAIGGASYDGSAASPQHLVVWNAPGSFGGGGGVSRVIVAPPWQPGATRAVPDLSVYSAPGGAGSIPVCATPSNCVWSAVGGTSLAATVMGATGALLEQQYGGAGPPLRLGNLAASIWRRTRHSHAVTDVVEGANTTFTHACCSARRGYDTASGWGLLDPDSLHRVVPRRKL
jgi:subtilase family serine protease